MAIRGHLHYRLLDSGRFSERQIVISYYVFAILFGSLTLFLESRFYKFLALSLMVGLVIVGFWLVGENGAADRRDWPRETAAEAGESTE